MFAVPLFLFFPTMSSFFFYWPFHTRLIACLIRAALLPLSAFVHIPMLCDRTVVLISDLLYQSAAFAFPDGSRVSELVMVSWAFHLFVVGTFLFALCSYGFDCSRPLVCCKQ